MSLTPTVEYYECDQCGAAKSHIHAAIKKVFMAGSFYDRTQHLCCGCYTAVGGTCDEG